MKSRIALAGIMCLVSGVLFAQKMTVKDSDSNVLMEVNDEGVVGSITVFSGDAPSTTTNKLYNVSGSLFWNGTALGTAGSAGGWTDGGANVYTTTSTDKVGIGTSTPEFKLSVIDDGGILAKGTYGSGITLSTAGAGTRLIWYPRKAALRAGYVDASNWDDANIGGWSTALGNNTTASGAVSTAMGQTTIASGNFSAALNIYSTAASYASTAFGRYNVGGGTADSWEPADPLFEIGIGTDSSAKADALTVLKNGNVGIGTTSPEFKLSLDNDGGILAKGTFNSGATLSTPGVGSRLIWYPRKAAFRAGYVDGSQWDNANIGNYSIAMGYRSIASGSFSMASGISTTASGSNSVAMGSSNTAGGSGSTALGAYTNASGDNSTTAGHETIASGIGSMAMDWGTKATGNYSTAMGFYTTASGNGSTAVGLNTKAGSYADLAVGQFNVGGGSAVSWVGTDPLFEIGIGTDIGEFAKNAVTVLKNGKVGIGDATPDYLLDMEADGVGGYYSASDHQWHGGSSRKLKQDIAPNDLDVQGVLNDVRIVKYRFKTEVADNPNASYHMGFIAEDTPEMLSGKDRNSMATGDCIGLLLAVVKEQQKEIETLKAEMKDLRR